MYFIFLLLRYNENHSNPCFLCYFSFLILSLLQNMYDFYSLTIFIEFNQVNYDSICQK